MELTVLGCSGSAPGPDSPASGYLVEHDGYRVVLDMGQGTFGALQRHVRPGDVDAVLLTHLHADHCIDLTAYVVGLRYGGDGFRAGGRRIPLIGPAGTRDRLETAYDPLARKVNLREMFGFAAHPAPGTPLELGPFTVDVAVMNHPVPTAALRLRAGGATLVYSGDTGESPALIGLARGADLLLCEASFGPDDPYVPDLHLTGRQAGEHAAKAGVGRLLVTHVPPWSSRDVAAEQAALAFPGTIELAAPDAVYRV